MIDDDDLLDGWLSDTRSALDSIGELWRQRMQYAEEERKCTLAKVRDAYREGCAYMRALAAEHVKTHTSNLAGESFAELGISLSQGIERLEWKDKE